MKKCPNCGKAMELEMLPPDAGRRKSSYVCRAHGCLNNPDFAEVAAEEVEAEILDEEGSPSEDQGYGVGPIP